MSEGGIACHEVTATQVRINAFIDSAIIVIISVLEQSTQAVTVLFKIVVITSWLHVLVKLEPMQSNPDYILQATWIFTQGH